MNIFRAAGGALRWVFARHGHVVIGAIPNRDAMSPPQLAADTPILDILKPVEINFFKTLRHDLDLSIRHCIKRRFSQAIRFSRTIAWISSARQFHRRVVSAGWWCVWLGLDDETGGFHISPDIFAAIESILTLILAAVFVDFRRLIQNRYDRQVMTMRDGIVIRVVSRRDL